LIYRKVRRSISDLKDYYLLINSILTNYHRVSCWWAMKNKNTKTFIINHKEFIRKLCKN